VNSQKNMLKRRALMLRNNASREPLRLKHHSARCEKERPEAIGSRSRYGLHPDRMFLSVPANLCQHSHALSWQLGSLHFRDALNVYSRSSGPDSSCAWKRRELAVSL
jgi:hypothetical protein